MARTTNPMTPEQLRLRSELGNAKRWSRVPYPERAASTAKARAALWDKYLRQVDPDGVLPEAERQALARQARRADMLAMALKASRNRSRKAGARNGRAT